MVYLILILSPFLLQYLKDPGILLGNLNANGNLYYPLCRSLSLKVKAKYSLSNKYIAFSTFKLFFDYGLLYSALADSNNSSIFLIELPNFLLLVVLS